MDCHAMKQYEVLLQKSGIKYFIAFVCYIIDFVWSSVCNSALLYAIYLNKSDM